RGKGKGERGKGKGFESCFELEDTAFITPELSTFTLTLFLLAY
ncbi:MAG: hypothetical protein ACJAR1_001180, partial [Rubritalea sp.]